ncbi:hypothetical protein AC622_02590 [Bacillus sp. FJAT-27916]|uniref:DUF86 domain-containing protein n=1 Tax=Bacillaceae TaxID=186817 RepID=UPI000670A600|nr:DUF86 domain-containing protein [Bacillus sp. FJAT-27916]KMY43280.1 hypothetical protein AC622_02590 [Bacillus sp. FJAT-27916]
MYFVDREAIEDKLHYLVRQIDLFEEKGSFDQSEYDQLILERLAHTMIDAVLDIGNAMIDGFIMRDPGSYEDIIDILVDEQVIDTDMETPFKAMLPFRKILVQDYTHTEHGELLAAVRENLSAFKAYPEKISAYLEKELGVVTAFIPRES